MSVNPSLRLRRVVAGLASVLLVAACGVDRDTSDGSGGSGGGDSGAPPWGSDVSSSSTSSSASGGGDDPSDSYGSDDAWDPCPEVEYTVQLEDGTLISFRLRVFCDPSADVYKGCPGPDGFLPSL